MGKRIHLEHDTQIRYFAQIRDVSEPRREKTLDAASTPPSSPSQSGSGTLRVFVHYLVRLVEKQAEVGEDDPELLPAVAVLELPQ